MGNSEQISQEQKYLYAFDFLKVVFIYLIVIHHGKLIGGGTEKLYIVVESFFMISGFLLFSTLFNTRITPIRYFCKRIKVLYPKYIIAFLLLFAGKFIAGGVERKHIPSYIVEALMLQDIGFPVRGTLNYPMWYMSVLLFGCLIVYSVGWLINVRLNCNLNILAVIISAILYVFLFVNNNNTIEQWGNTARIVSLPLLRGIADLLAGYSIAYFSLKLRKKQLSNYSLIILIVYMAAIVVMLNDYILIALSIALIFVASFEESLLSRLGKHKEISFLEKHEYSIYLNHALIIMVFNKLAFIKQMPLWIQGVLLISLVTCFAILFDFVFGLLRCRVVRKNYCQ